MYKMAAEKRIYSKLKTLLDHCFQGIPGYMQKTKASFFRNSSAEQGEPHALTTLAYVMRRD
jgi:hypothetical protein